MAHATLPIWNAGGNVTDQRYYNANYGTLWSPDPGGLATANPKNPTSWNRYLYANGDPVNFGDPSGKSVLSAIWGFLTGGDDEPLPDVGSDPDDDNPYPCGGDYFAPAPNPAYYAPVPPPPPPSPTAGACDLSVAYSGAPRGDATVLGNYNSPTENVLGPYTTIGAGVPPSDTGWFYALQVQGDLPFDVNAGDWQAEQTEALSGGITYQTLSGTVSSLSQVGMMNPDGPPPYAITALLPGTFDWTDLPGYASILGNTGATIVSADLTFNFAATLINTVFGGSCSTTWSLHLTVNSPGWSFTH